MRYDKKYKNYTFSENFYFFDEKYFSKDFEKSKISKSHFFRKSWLFRKIENLWVFPKKLTFWKFWVFQQKSKKWLFEIFDFSKSFEKYFSSKKKIIFFGKSLLFIFVSYLMYYLIGRHSGSSAMPLAEVIHEIW